MVHKASNNLRKLYRKGTRLLEEYVGRMEGTGGVFSLQSLQTRDAASRRRPPVYESLTLTRSLFCVLSPTFTVQTG